MVKNKIKGHMYGSIKWFKGENYYKVRNYLLKNGFHKTSDYGYYDANKTKGWQTFDDGTETIKINCNLKRNAEGKLVCDSVYEVNSKIYDSVEIGHYEKALLEAIQKGLEKSLK